MSSPLFILLQRNMGVPDVDRPESVSRIATDKVTGKARRKLNRKTSQKVIDAWLVANELVKSGMSKSQASKEAGFRHQVGWSNLACNWKRIEAAARAQQS